MSQLRVYASRIRLARQLLVIAYSHKSGSFGRTWLMLVYAAGVRQMIGLLCRVRPRIDLFNAASLAYEEGTKERTVLAKSTSWAKSLDGVSTVGESTGWPTNR